MTTGNLDFIYDSVSDRSEVTLTASSEVASVENLRDHRPMKRWIASEVDGAWVKLDAGEGRRLVFNAIAYVGHNGYPGTLAQPATVRTRASDSADMSSPLLDRTDKLIQKTVGFGALFGKNFLGYPSVEELRQLTPFRVIDPDGQIKARYLEARFSNPTNPALQFKLGRVLAGIPWRPSRNFRFGWSWKWVDPSTVKDTTGGGFIGSRQLKVREFTLSIGSGALPLAELCAYADTMLATVGQTRCFLMRLFPKRGEAIVRRTSVYGRFVGDASIVGEHPDLGSVAQLVVREVR